MTRVTTLFYDLGGYNTGSNTARSDYISLAQCTGTYIPYAIDLFNRLCSGSVTFSYTYSSGSDSVGTPVDDRIIAELALSFADADYDKIHQDPDTGASVNRHRAAAYDLILTLYGKRDRWGRMMFPSHVDGAKPYKSASIADVTYGRA